MDKKFYILIVVMVSLVERSLGANDVSNLFLTQSSKTKWPQKKQRRLQFRRAVVVYFREE